MAVAVLAVTSAAAQALLDDPPKIADAEKLLEAFLPAGRDWEKIVRAIV